MHDEPISPYRGWVVLASRSDEPGIRDCSPRRYVDPPHSYDYSEISSIQDRIEFAKYFPSQTRGM